MNYQEFLESKKLRSITSGFGPSSLNSLMFPFQKKITEEALSKGRFGIFADCGLGKSLMQLEWAHQVSDYKNQPVLIACPLAVAGQTLKEAHKFGYTDISRAGTDTAIQIINYDQLHTIDPSKYAGIVLDESSILKNYEGAYRNMIIDNFRHTPYKLACTATPAPNDPMELGNHSEFLGAMSRTEILSMFFVQDGDRDNPVHCPISVDTWQKYASPVWMDIDYGDTLNAAVAREDKDEKHICPLQLPTIERLITLYSNEGDTVLTLFMGIGSEVFQAVKMMRKAIGIELKRTYYDIAVKNIKAAELQKGQTMIFS